MFICACSVQAAYYERLRQHLPPSAVVPRIWASTRTRLPAPSSWVASMGSSTPCTAPRDSTSTPPFTCVTGPTTPGVWCHPPHKPRFLRALDVSLTCTSDVAECVTHARSPGVRSSAREGISVNVMLVATSNQLLRAFVVLGLWGLFIVMWLS